MKPLFAFSIMFLAALLPQSLVAQGAEPPPAGTNFIHGTVRFTNADGDILARLGPPGNEGMSWVSLVAYTDVPEPLQSSRFFPALDPLINPYSVTVAANDIPLTYTIFAALALDSNTREYWTPRIAAAPLTSNSPPALVDFDECVALVEVRYVDSAGAPFLIGGGQVVASETASGIMRGRIYAQTAGVSSEFLVVPSGVELAFTIDVITGTDVYLNTITHRETRTATYACDEKAVITVTVPDAGSLGRITGNANLVGPIELPTEGYLELLGRPVIKATGPLNNQRYAALAAEAPGPDATRSFALEGLIPSTAAQPWNAWTEMHFGSGHRFEHFRSPGLGEGSFNPGIILSAGTTKDVGDTFVMTPATLVGNITLVGPPEFAGSISPLRGMVRASDFDADMNGIPDAIGATTMNGSYVVMNGVDELVPGSTFTTAGGQATMSIGGGYNAGVSAFVGDYEATLGMLDNQPGVWEQDGIAVRLYQDDAGTGQHVDQLLYIAENAPWQGILGPGERATNHLRYGMAEVCLRIKSPANFFSPRVGYSTGGFTGVDFDGNFRSYSVQILNAYSPPHSAELATNEAVITFLVPEGTYTLKPAISVPNADGGASDVQLPSVEVTVTARERYCIEECIRVFIEPPMCTTNFGFIGWGRAVSTCGNTLTNISVTIRPLANPSIRLGYSERWLLGGNTTNEMRMPGQVFPEFDGFLPDHPEYYENMVYTVVAHDILGNRATRQAIFHYDFTPPPLNCADITVTSANGVDAVVEFNPVTPDVWTFFCTPPSGSMFPIGVTPVTCFATDLCRNTNTCTFNVTVLDPNAACELRIALSQISPPEVKLTWECAAQLQASVNANGPWFNVVGATSPYTTPADGLHRFFRLCVSGDCSTPSGDCVRAGLLAHESFDYPDGLALDGLNGGLGFAGAWTPVIAGANYTIAAGSPGYDFFCASGGRMTSPVGFTRMNRQLAAGFGASGTTRYFSFLIRPEGVLDAGDFGGFHGLALQGGPGAQSLFIGKPGGAGGGVLAPYVLEEIGGAGQVVSTVAPVVGETALLVVKAEFGAGNDTFTLYVNPPTGGAEPASGVTKSDLDVGMGEALFIYSGGAFSLDEIRVGETFESVTPRP